MDEIDRMANEGDDDEDEGRDGAGGGEGNSCHSVLSLNESRNPGVSNLTYPTSCCSCAGTALFFSLLIF